MLLKPARHREASAEADGQFDDFNAQHCMNLFPKVAKIARKRLFTSLSTLHAHNSQYECKYSSHHL